MWGQHEAAWFCFYSAMDLLGVDGTRRPSVRSVMQAVVRHPHTGVAQRVNGMHENRVSAVRAGLLWPIRRRVRQMVARRTPDHVEGADPGEQAEVDRRGRGGRQNGDDSDGEDLFERHNVNLQPTLDGRDRRYAPKLRRNCECPVAEVITWLRRVTGVSRFVI